MYTAHTQGQMHPQQVPTTGNPISVDYVNELQEKQEKRQRERIAQIETLASKLEDKEGEYMTVIPDELSKFYLRRAGCPDNKKMTRLLSLSVQHFMCNVIEDAYQVSQARYGGDIKESQSTYRLELDCLDLALRRFGINLDKEVIADK